MKCVVAGSRGIGLDEDGKQMNIEDCLFVLDAFTKCCWYDRITEIVSGRAKGVDNLGEQIARKLNLNMTAFPADWSLGKRAGHIRNKDMAEYADIAIVMMKNRSKGSMNMIDQMKKLKKPVMVYELINGELILSELSSA